MKEENVFSVKDEGHNKLRGKIVEVLGTRGGKARLCEQLKITSASLENKLKGKTEFKISEMLKISEILGISKNDIHEYFFYSEGEDIDKGGD